MVDKENDWHKAVVFYTGSAYSYLIEQMRWPHQDKEDPRDPDFPQYMLGDPTNPKGALEWHIDKVQLDPRDTQETNVICFTERREFLDPDQKVRPVRPELIEARFMLPDPNNWNIPTYEEQVAYFECTAGCGAPDRRWEKNGIAPVDRSAEIWSRAGEAPSARSTSAWVPPARTPRMMSRARSASAPLARSLPLTRWPPLPVVWPRRAPLRCRPSRWRSSRPTRPRRLLLPLTTG